jgi:ATP/maltotriose-dependent transcriptional regulator MalT
MKSSFSIPYNTIHSILRHLGIAAATVDQAGRVTAISSEVHELFGNRVDQFCRLASELGKRVLDDDEAKAERSSTRTPDGRFRVTAHKAAAHPRVVAIVVVHAVRSLESGLKVETSSDPLWRLSSREREVAVLIAGGASNQDIATALGISQHTVRRHTERVFSKLGVHRRLQLVRLMAEPRNWVELPIGVNRARSA